MLERQTLANAIRVLSMDAVQKANSGHPGMPMGMADIAEALWNHHLKHNPQDPTWFDRDRFVLSNGHGSMLIYSLLHLTGYDLSIDDIKAFRQLHSKTPGHPEYRYTPGVETTTGPLGQGITNAVGMALAEKLLAQTFNRQGYNIVDHQTYVFLGDGCLMEGISHEACSLAGTWGLGKLIAFYDDNNISIDGHVDGWFSDDTPKRFESYGWQVISAVDGHDFEALDGAIAAAKAEKNKPTLICCKTIIGKGSPNKAGGHDCHGAPLGDKEIALVREALGWTLPPFEIPEEIYAAWDAKEKGAACQAEWQTKFNQYQNTYPELASEFLRRMKGDLPLGWSEIADAAIEKIASQAQTIATRKASQNSIEAYAPSLPEFLGGSADLTGSNLTNWSGTKSILNGQLGNYLHYGVREFGMSAILNGVTLHGGFKPYGGTFLMFSEYARNALRMAALMKINPIFVFTHDSIGLGEDGPTHQPVEQTATLRLIPNMDVWRPADTVETAVAWRSAIERAEGPSCLIFTRQNLPFLHLDDNQRQEVKFGGYILKDQAEPQLILIATGSEVQLAMSAANIFEQKGVRVRVVSMPSTNVFDRQSEEYRARVLPKGVKRLAIEAGHPDGWYKYVGLEGDVVGMATFGESAPASELFKLFGFTVENVVNKGLTLLQA